MEAQKTLGAVDIAQIIAAGGTMLTAIIALITTFQNHKSIDRQKAESHAMIKPHFIINGNFEDRVNRIYKFNIVNIGYAVLNDIAVKWKGTEKAGIRLDKYIDDEGLLSYVIELDLSHNKVVCDIIKGEIILCYVDVFGKAYEDSLYLEFRKIHEDDTNGYYLLKNVDLHRGR